ncbi:MAG: aldehyde ferredoxin oxidoreductase [Desulfovibrio sp.]|jgi:aldehyde:ferredoxin oxidoreductase|nr:aldehyde ferredoxin oxidoreductase [Desulfovibrio sp.]
MPPIDIARPFSRILHYDATSGKARVEEFGLRAEHLGGSGLAAALYEASGLAAASPDAEEQPIIFAVGPLTGLFPLMSKCVCGFRSPYNGQWTESHAGGRLALALRFAGYDALVVTGRASELSCLIVGGHRVRAVPVPFLRGADVFRTGKYMRGMVKGFSGHRSTIRIGRAGENGVGFACINVDSFRHFGRLGSGAVLGGKNIKGIQVVGDSVSALPPGKSYPSLVRDIQLAVTTTSAMRKYHDLGTPENLEPLNKLHALPWRNLQKTSDSGISDMTGQRIAEDLLLRQSACAGCPVGCIHIALLREQFGDEHDYLYKQVPYDYEPLFSLGTMLHITDPERVLSLMDETEKTGLDCMSAGVALAWAAEAFEKGLVSEKETLVPLRFGEWEGFETALRHLAGRDNDFYRLLGQGALAAAACYGGDDFACVLGQEMAGYATGEVFFVAQTLGFRHSHLDNGGYSFDQTVTEKDAGAAVKYLLKDEHDRVMLTCMVACLFARKVYTTEKLQECLSSLGLEDMAGVLPEAAGAVRDLRWKLKMGTGFDPQKARIPKRFTEITTWKGGIDATYMEETRGLYSREILRMGGR